MQISFNIRHLENGTVRLAGELPAGELELEQIDEMIQAGKPLKHDLEVERHDRAYLVHGSLELPIRCECVRCLKPFESVIRLPNWSCLLPLEGEDKVLIVNDRVDLTPYVREDIVLAFPQHPLCEPECCGLVATRRSDGKTAMLSSPPEDNAASAWSELNKLKL